MKRKSQDPLREALNALVRSEAILVEAQAGRDREIAQIERRLDERVSRIEAMIARLIEIIPDALRERIGIQPKPQT